jgi:O-antigen ligase
MVADRVRQAIAETRTGPERAILFLLILFLLSSAFSIFLSQVGYFGALIVWCYLLYRKRPFNIRTTGAELFFILYAVAELVATVFAYNQAQSLLYLQRRLLLIPIIYVILNNAASRPVLQTLFLSTILSALGVALWSSLDLLVHLAEYLRFERRLAEFQIYMTAGGIMMIVALLLLPFVLHPGTPRRVRALAGLALIPMGINLLFTFTRSSWLGFLVGGVVIGIRRYRVAVLPLLALVLLVVSLSSPEMRDRMTSTFDLSHSNNATRLHMWQVGLRMLADHPLVGIGDIGTEQLWERYAEPGWQPEGHLHNNILMWLVTLGVPGFLVLVAVFTRLWMRIWGIEKLLKDDWFAGSLALGSLGVMAGFHVNGLFEWNFGDAEIIMLVWAIVGMAFAAERVGRHQ